MRLATIAVFVLLPAASSAQAEPAGRGEVYGTVHDSYIALAHVSTEYGSPGTHLELEVTVEHRRNRAEAVARKLPFCESNEETLMIPWPMLLLALAPQSPDTLPVHLGAQVRVVTTDLSRRPLAGVMTANDSGRVVVLVSDKGSVVSIPWKDVADVSASRGRARGLGMVAGAALGLVGGAVVYSMMAKPDFVLDALIEGLLLFGYAPVMGGIVGSRMVPERWERMVVPRTWESPASTAVSLHFGPADRVRLTTRSDLLVGRVGQYTRDSLTVATGKRTVPLLWSDVTRVEVRGTQNRWVGALLGTGAGLLLAVIGLSDSPTTGSTEGAYFLSGIAGASLGAVILAPRLWKSLPFPSR